MQIKRVKYDPTLSATRYITLAPLDNWACIEPTFRGQFILTIYYDNDLSLRLTGDSVKNCYKCLRTM